MTDLAKLKAPFAPDRISWRVGSTNADKSKGMALAYIDARDVQDRLDEVCGVDGWQCRYVPMHDKKTVCEIGIKIYGNLTATMGAGTVEWVWKADGAGDSDVEAEKGALSDAFKRAAVKWGIGRYLYDLDSPWVALEPAGRSFKIAAGEYARLRSLLAKDASKPTMAPPDPPAIAAEMPVVTQTPPVTTPEEWAKKALARVKGFKTRTEMDEFETKYHTKIAQIRLSVPDLHKQIIAAIQAKNMEMA